MSERYTYFIILLLSIAGPLALSFDRKVAFYKKWKYVFPAMILPAVFFIVWDCIFTHNGVWSFNSRYITGLHVFNIPLEEALFFFAVPYCCVFIYECIRCYWPLLRSNAASVSVFRIMGVSLVVAGVLLWGRDYSFYTFIFCGLLLLLLSTARKYFASFNTTVFLLAYLVILLPFLAVNGVLTWMPVVLYNDSRNMAFRIFTIPFEDIFYGMLLILMNVSIFERLRAKRSA